LAILILEVGLVELNQAEKHKMVLVSILDTLLGHQIMNQIW